MLTFAYAIYYKEIILKPKIFSNFSKMKHYSTIPYNSKYLTVWGLYANFIYMVLAICNKLFLKNKYSKVVSILWQSIIIPISIIVSSYFWILQIFAPDMLTKPSFQKFMPPIDQHLSHTVCIITLIFETIYIKHDQVSVNTILKWNVAFFTAYLSWIMYIFNVTGRWPYPVIVVLWKTPMKIGMIILPFITLILTCILSKTIGAYNKSITTKRKVRINQSSKKLK